MLNTNASSPLKIRTAVRLIVTSWFTFLYCWSPYADATIRAAPEKSIDPNNCTMVRTGVTRLTTDMASVLTAWLTTMPSIVVLMMMTIDDNTDETIKLRSE